jgi:4-aminobutyrate aminotransferase-like enzyme
MNPTRRSSIAFRGEDRSNAMRASIADREPISLRTFTPSQLVIERSAGLFHYSPDGRRLADFTSGGHNPRRWWERLATYMGWSPAIDFDAEYLPLPPLTAYNAISTLEVEANHRLLASLHRTPFGSRLQQVMWSASGSEGVQKALWACLHFQPERDVILATRHGFHGKKGLAEAVTGDETSPNRDSRVTFIDFPRESCRDLVDGNEPYDAARTTAELERLWERTGGRINCVITEPYLGGGGSYHPPKAYHRALVDFCRQRNVAFILDEVQSNFGRTGSMYAFETYEIEPDVVVLGKGLGNGVPVNCAVGRADVFASLAYGGASDTWSAHPLGCAAALATLDVFENENVVEHARNVSRIVEGGLRRLRELPHVMAVRGEGMVWGVEAEEYAGRTANEVAVECVLDCYRGDENGDAIHLLGPLAGNVIRISPPLTMTVDEAGHWMEVLVRLFGRTAERLAAAPAGVARRDR